MIGQLKTHIDRAFQLTSDLVAHLDESSLELDLRRLPSNRIAGQLWCIVGARESYARAIESGSWQGFSCSLNSPRVKASVLDALASSRSQVDRLDFAKLDGAQTELAFALLEHEVQHHGQLIRYVYANGLTFPPSWHERYTV